MSSISIENPQWNYSTFTYPSYPNVNLKIPTHVKLNYVYGIQAEQFVCHGEIMIFSFICEWGYFSSNKCIYCLDFVKWLSGYLFTWFFECFEYFVNYSKTIMVLGKLRNKLRNKNCAVQNCMKPRISKWKSDVYSSQEIILPIKKHNCRIFKIRINASSQFISGTNTL